MKKSMIDLVGSEVELTDIDKAVKMIHRQNGEALKRFSISMPEHLHKQLKKIAIDEGLHLKEFFLQAALEKCERMEYSLDLEQHKSE